MDWQAICLERIRQRNRIQTEPFAKIYDSNNILWKSNQRLERIHDLVSHQIALLHYEIVEGIRRNDLTMGINHLSNKLYIIEEELRSQINLSQGIEDPTVSTESSAEGTSTLLPEKVVLSRLIQDQKKKITNLTDELTIAKSELSTYQHRVLALEKEIASLRGTSTVRDRYRTSSIPITNHINSPELGSSPASSASGLGGLGRPSPSIGSKSTSFSSSSSPSSSSSLSLLAAEKSVSGQKR